MKHEKGNNSLAMLLFLTLFIAIFAVQPVRTFAASKMLASVQSRTATAFDPVNFPIQVKYTSDVEVRVNVPSPTGLTINVCNSKGNIVGNPLHISSYDSSWMLDGKGWYTNKYLIDKLEAGNYTVEYTFDQDVIFDAKIIQLSTGATLAEDKITVTQGFSHKMTINHAKVKSFSSNNKKIASVDSKGNITGKKPGNTIITAKLSSGKKLNCKVTVKSNIYSAQKISSDYVGQNEYAVSAYSASYQSGGNIKINFRIVNETDNMINAIPKFNIIITNQKNKTVANFQRTSYKVSVPSHSYRDYTITINKKSISEKKIDLRNSIIKISGERVDL